MGTFAFSWHAMETRCQRPAVTCAAAERELCGTDSLCQCHMDVLLCGTPSPSFDFSKKRYSLYKSLFNAPSPLTH